MAEVLVVAGTRQVPVEMVTPNAQISTASVVAVTGSEIDARAWRSVAYTVAVATNTVQWWVYGANASDYSDEVIVDGPSDVAAAAADSYAVEQAPYAYYRVKIIDKVGGTHGTVTVRGIAKG